MSRVFKCQTKRFYNNAMKEDQRTKKHQHSNVNRYALAALQVEIKDASEAVDTEAYVVFPHTTDLYTDAEFVIKH